MEATGLSHSNPLDSPISMHGATQTLFVNPSEVPKPPSPVPAHASMLDRSSPHAAGITRVSEMAPALDALSGSQPVPESYIANEVEMSQNDLELEILLRGNLLQQQQQRIFILETSLSNTCAEVEKFREQLQEMENDKGSQPSKPQPKAQSRYWTAEEHQQFLIGLEKYGPRDVKSIAALVGTRNATQVRTHAQKYFLRVARENGELEKVAANGEDASQTDANDANSKKRPMEANAPSGALDSNLKALEPPEPKQSPELMSEPDPSGVPNFTSGFEASMGTDFDAGLGTDFDVSLEMPTAGIQDLGSASDSQSKGPDFKRMKEMPKALTEPDPTDPMPPTEPLESADLEEVNAESVAQAVGEVSKAFEVAS